MAARPTRPARTVDCYGCSWPAGTHPVQIELDCIKHGGRWIANNHPRGAGLETHIINVSKLLWPWFTWHRWARNIHLPELCRPHHRLAVFGPSSSGKSSTTALVYLLYYFARPSLTTVMLSSTTFDELELRIWGEMKMYFREAKEQCPWLPGNLIDSKHAIATDEKGSDFGRDFRNGVTCRPAKIGNKWVVGSGMSPYIGIKNDYVYAAADEFGIMPPGIMDALANLNSNPSCCASYLGNLGDLDTPLGSASEPEHGWSALPDSPVSRAYDTRWSNGRAIQFVGMDSPNLDHPADAEPYPKIIGRRYIEQCAKDYGRDTPFFNMFAAGAIPRGTMENRVITRADCERHNAFEPVIWGHEPITKLYCADLSYTAIHGDKTVGRPLAFGRDSTGTPRLAPLELPKVYTPSDRSTASIEEQIASEMVAECRRLEIPLSNVFYDGTGRSSFTAAIMRLPGGTAVQPIEFGGRASNRPNFMGRRYEEDGAGYKKGDLLPCTEVFDRMVSELWFALRALVEFDQGRAIDLETILEASKRLWKLSAGNRVSVEPKSDMKLRLGRSPDSADTLVVGIEGARRLGFPLGKVGQAPQKQQRWLRQLDKSLREAHSAVELTVA